jgi:hypothetical protein
VNLLIRDIEAGFTLIPLLIAFMVLLSLLDYIIKRRSMTAKEVAYDIAMAKVMETLTNPEYYSELLGGVQLAPTIDVSVNDRRFLICTGLIARELGAEEVAPNHWRLN